MVYFPAVAPPDAYAALVDNKVGNNMALPVVTAVVRKCLLLDVDDVSSLLSLVCADRFVVDICLVSTDKEGCAEKPYVLPTMAAAVNNIVFIIGMKGRLTPLESESKKQSDG